MLKNIVLVLCENDKVIERIEKETFTETSELLKSLEEFRKTVNETLTKIIDDVGFSDDFIEDDAVSDEEEEKQASPKKRKM